MKHLENKVRSAPHPEAPMRYEPRLPRGCDQQGRYPQAAEPVCDEDELGVKRPPPEPWWQDALLVVVVLLVMVLVFAPLGVGK